MARESIALCLESFVLDLKHMGNLIMMARKNLTPAGVDGSTGWRVDNMASGWRAERKKGRTGPEVDGDSIGNCRNGAGIQTLLETNSRNTWKMDGLEEDSASLFGMPGLCSGAFDAVVLGG